MARCGCWCVATAGYIWGLAGLGGAVSSGLGRRCQQRAWAALPAQQRAWAALSAQQRAWAADTLLCTGELEGALWERVGLLRMHAERKTRVLGGEGELVRPLLQLLQLVGCSFCRLLCRLDYLAAMQNLCGIARDIVYVVQDWYSTFSLGRSAWAQNHTKQYFCIGKHVKLPGSVEGTLRGYSAVHTSSCGESVPCVLILQCTMDSEKMITVQKHSDLSRQILRRQIQNWSGHGGLASLVWRTAGLVGGRAA